MLKRTCKPFWTKGMQRAEAEAGRLMRQGKREEAGAVFTAIERAHATRAAGQPAMRHRKPRRAAQRGR